MSLSNQGLRRPNRLKPNPDGSPAVEQGHGAHEAPPPFRPAPVPAGRKSGRPDTIELGHLPPMGLLLARPLLLLICALIGAGVGFAVTGNGGYSAQSVLEFTPPGTDSLLVKQTGQTLARNAVATDVLQAAQNGTTGASDDLAGRVTAEWQADTKLVVITVTASTGEVAIADANAIAQTMVQISESSINTRLAQARDQSNEVLNSEQLDSTDAESARRAQLGSSLGSRQDAIASQSGELTVADPATEASVAGLSKPIGVAIGFVAGLLLGGLLSLLLGVRGLRARSARELHQLIPDAELSSPAQAAQLAGQIIESGRSAVAVVVTKGAEVQSNALAGDVAEFLRAHGRSVAQMGPFNKGDRAAALNFLRRDVRNDVPGRVGTDMLLVVVEEGSEASALLEGQSDLCALIVMRRRRTPISSALRVMRSYEYAEPVLVLAR
jgi:hypothetical protein